MRGGMSRNGGGLLVDGREAYFCINLIGGFGFYEWRSGGGYIKERRHV
jgi:hypothetical protein